MTAEKQSNLGDKSDKVLTKSVKFNGKELKLYSLDGNTWSSRKEELTTIKERFENTRLSMTLDGAKQGKRLFGKAKRAPVTKVAGADAGFADVELDSDFPEELIPEDVPLDDATFEDIDAIDVISPKAAKVAKTSKVKPETGVKAKKENKAIVSKNLKDKKVNKTEVKVKSPRANTTVKKNLKVEKTKAKGSIEKKVAKKPSNPAKSPVKTKKKK